MNKINLHLEFNPETQDIRVFREGAENHRVKEKELCIYVDKQQKLHVIDEDAAESMMNAWGDELGFSEFGSEEMQFIYNDGDVTDINGVEYLFGNFIVSKIWKKEGRSEEQDLELIADELAGRSTRLHMGPFCVEAFEL